MYQAIQVRFEKNWQNTKYILIKTKQSNWKTDDYQTHHCLQASLIAKTVLKQIHFYNTVKFNYWTIFYSSGSEIGNKKAFVGSLEVEASWGSIFVFGEDVTIMIYLHDKTVLIIQAKD